MLVNRVAKSSLLFAAVVAAVSSAAALADTSITSLTPGDLVVLRGGDATNPDTTASTNQVSVYLDEFTLSGAYVGTINVPSSGGSALTIPSIGDFQHQGILSLSTNNNLLTFAGYQAAAGSADADAQTTTAYQPVIGVIGSTASSLTTNTVVNSYGASTPSANPYIRGAVTNNGNEFWTFGKYSSSGATSNGGLAYVSGSGSTATTTTVEGFADWRDIVAVNSQLYGGTGSSSVGNHGPYQISTGEPTTNLGNSLANNTQLGAYPGGQSASALALLDLPGNPNSVNGVNTLYTIGDQGTPGIVKYSYNGSTWVNDGLDVGLTAVSNVTNPTGLVAYSDPQAGNPNDVFLAISGSNGIYTYVDTNGPTGAIPSDAFTLVDSNPTNEAFYGLSLTPGTSSVPEPTSLALVAAGAIGLLGRRRRA